MKQGFPLLATSAELTLDHPAGSSDRVSWWERLADKVSFHSQHYPQRTKRTADDPDPRDLRHYQIEMVGHPPSRSTALSLRCESAWIAMLLAFDYASQANIAVERNVICFLPTGAGKTFVAVRFAEHVLKHRSRRCPIAFLVDRIPLVFQQAEVFIKQSNPPMSVGRFCGDVVRSTDWKKEMGDHDVLVFTAGLLLNLLEDRKAFGVTFGAMRMPVCVLCGLQ